MEMHIREQSKAAAITKVDPKSSSELQVQREFSKDELVLKKASKYF